MIAVPSLATDSTCWLKENEEQEKNANKKDVKFLLEKSVAKKEGNVPKINEVKPKDRGDTSIHFRLTVCVTV